MAQASAVDFLVVGAGCIGLRIAIELKKRHPDCSVLAIDKEDSLGAHASGRNSGVIHAGFYYPGDTMKARFCAEGNRELTQYCLDRKLKINQCGKLVVATRSSEVDGLRTLIDRAEQNGVSVSPVDAEYAKQIEPCANAPYGGLYSPTTSTVNPLEVMQAYRDEAAEVGVEISLGETFIKRSAGSVMTSKRNIACRYVVNAAGLHADTIAHQFGFGQNYSILPFRGIYLYAENNLSIKTNIYPVPDLKNPFLGVHVTVNAEGRIKLGPTAIPCLWREQYEGLSRFQAAEFLRIALTSTPLLFTGTFNLRALAYREGKKRFKGVLVREACKLAPITADARYCWGKPGIRAQLVNRKTKSLVMDFCIEGDNESMHVLNAVSPAFTCAIPFARHVADEIDSRLQR